MNGPSECEIRTSIQYRGVWTMSDNKMIHYSQHGEYCHCITPHYTGVVNSFEYLGYITGKKKNWWVQNLQTFVGMKYYTLPAFHRNTDI